LTSAPGREYWDVFAREDGSHPLRHVGAVEAADGDDAQVFASTLYDEFRWAEMFVTPRRAIIKVIRPV
jgi:1,2-phenylacetyl-CoA epoxidase PaaB subunit